MEVAVIQGIRALCLWGAAKLPGPERWIMLNGLGATQLVLGGVVAGRRCLWLD